MSTLQKNALRDLSGEYCLPFTNRKLDFFTVFQNVHDTYLEIGFGMGMATAEIAEKNPQNNYLGVEVHTPGVGKLLSEIKNRKLYNVRIIEHDAVEVVNTMIPNESLQGVHIFFPDPWPKRKHHKRRLIQDAFIRLIIPKIKQGGYLYIATDWEPYALWIIDTLNRFKELSNRYHGFAGGIGWRPVTAFERKGTEQNHSIRNIWYDKKVCMIDNH